MRIQVVSASNSNNSKALIYTKLIQYLQMNLLRRAAIYCLLSAAVLRQQQQQQRHQHVDGDVAAAHVVAAHAATVERDVTITALAAVQTLRSRCALRGWAEVQVLLPRRLRSVVRAV